MIEGFKEICNIDNINVDNCHFDGVTSDGNSITGMTKNVRFNNLYINGKLVK